MFPMLCNACAKRFKAHPARLNVSDDGTLQHPAQLPQFWGRASAFGRKADEVMLRAAPAWLVLAHDPVARAWMAGDEAHAAAWLPQ